MTLFQVGQFVLNSGRRSTYKIECDALTSEDWAGVAAMIMEERLLRSFRAAVGVPRGGVPFAQAMSVYGTGDRSHPVLICEDVVTTGGSMERWRKVLLEDPQTIDPPAGHIGVVLFARGLCPEWVTPVFQMPLIRGDHGRS